MFWLTFTLIKGTEVVFLKQRWVLDQSQTHFMDHAQSDASFVHKTTCESHAQDMTILEPQDVENCTRKLRLVVQM